MKESFEPIRLRENSRKRVLRELIKYNEFKGEKSISTINKAQHELKPNNKKKTSIILEIVAGAAVIAMIAGGIIISVKKNGNNNSSPGSNENYTEAGYTSLNTQPSDAPMLEFISSEKLGASIAINKYFYSGYEINSDGSILLYKDDYGTETGLNWNCIKVSASTMSYEDSIEQEMEHPFDDGYGLLGTENVFIGYLLYDYQNIEDANFAALSRSSGISATKFSYSYDLPDINVTEYKETYIIDSHTYSDTYGAYTITATYQIIQNEGDIQYSTDPQLIYNIIDTFSFITYVKDTFYILPESAYVYANSDYDNSDNTADTDYIYSIAVSHNSDVNNVTQADYILNLPVGHLYDIDGTRDTDIDGNYYTAFDGAAVIDVYYSYYEGAYEENGPVTIFPAYCVLYSPFNTDTDNQNDNNSNTKIQTKPTDTLLLTMSLNIFPQDSKLLSVGEDYCTIYGCSDELDNSGSFDYDYIIYVPIECIYDDDGNQIGEYISNIEDISPSISMTVYHNIIMESYPAQIVAEKVVIHGLKKTF